jgi:REP element-mobilizing transposase RayT
MANSFKQIYVHVIFAVKGRQSLLKNEHREELHKYMTGIVKERECKLVAINSVSDHLHLMLAYNPKVVLADVIRDLKAFSSKMMNERGWFEREFHWQNGYGAFSVSPSQADTVVRYIANQEEHHRKKTFREEFVEFLKNSGIEFDPKYLFDPIEE